MAPSAHEMMRSRPARVEMMGIYTRRAILAGSSMTALALSIGPASAFDPGSRSPFNTDRKGLALRGHDPVAYFTVGQPTKGQPELTSTHEGATYHFASAANKATFDAAPQRYLPQYGGFCAWAAAQGYKADADPHAWSIVDGRLYVNYNASVHRTWRTRQTHFIRQGDANWSKVKDQAPR